MVFISKKGMQQERDCVNMLVNNGVFAVRVAGSGAGSSGRGVPDVVAKYKSNVYAIEVKSSSKDVIYVEDSQIKRLVKFCSCQSVIPVIAIKFNWLPFVFLKLKELECTSNGNRKISRERVRLLSKCEKYTILPI